jgi:hypothetical protein
MYTSYIGQKFLALYNKHNNTRHSAKYFFDEVMFPLFFDDNRHLLHVNNSPFFQKPSPIAVKKAGSKALAQLYKLHEDIASQPPNMATFVGYAAKDLQGTTSGQLTSLDCKIEAEELYASWVGEALALGISGGLTLLIDEEDVLWTLYKGWEQYRNYLKQTPNIKDKQIQTWNGHWLCYAYEFNDVEVPDSCPELNLKEQLGQLAITTQNWARIVFALVRKFPERILTAYCYNFSQTNTTIGFVNFYLSDVQKLIDYNESIFQRFNHKIIQTKNFEELYEPYYSFKNAYCKLGSIGLAALEPNNLREYLPYPYGRGNDFLFNNVDSFSQYQLIKSWINAMLSNKAELNRLAEQVATALIDFENRHNETRRSKSDISQLSTMLKNSKKIKNFVDNVTEIMAEDGFANHLFKEAKDNIYLMPEDLFPLFITLVRFEYQYQKSVQPKL